MEKVIEYYIPTKFIPAQPKWMPETERGKVLDFWKALLNRANKIASGKTSR